MDVYYLMTYPRIRPLLAEIEKDEISEKGRDSLDLYFRNIVEKQSRCP